MTTIHARMAVIRAIEKHCIVLTLCDMLCMQIELMLTMGVKAEIQCLYAISHNFLTNVYLPNKLQYGGWI